MFTISMHHDNTFHRSILIIFIIVIVIPYLNSIYTPKKIGTSNSLIAYGGILNEVARVTGNHTLTAQAAQYALAYAVSRHPETVLRDNQGGTAPYSITAARALKLVYTADDRNPYIYQAVDSSGYQYFQTLTWGYTFSFRVSWEGDTHPWIHTFVVTLHEDQFYVFQHTFHEQTGFLPKPLPQGWETTDTSHSLLRQRPPPVVEAYVSGPQSGLGYCHKETDLVTLWTTSPLATYAARHDGKLGSGRSHDDIQPHDDLRLHPGVTEDWKTGGGPRTCTAPVRNITLLCYNIWNTNTVAKQPGEYKTRLHKMGQLLQSSEADIIGVQEVRFQDGCCDGVGPNQVQHLAQVLPGYQFVYRPGQIQQSQLPVRAEEGVAFYARHPVTKVRHILLSRNASDIADTHQRVLLHIEVDIPCFGPVNVLTTHLSLSHVARATSVIEIWNYIKKLDGPVFLMGDFNAEKHNPEIKFLQGFLTLRGVSTTGLHDVWSTLYPQDPGFTFSTLEEKLTKRIDFIFMREDPRVLLTDTYLLDDAGRGLNAPSDHIGLVARFALKVEKYF